LTDLTKKSYEKDEKISNLELKNKENLEKISKKEKELVEKENKITSLNSKNKIFLEEKNKLEKELSQSEAKKGLFWKTITAIS